MALSSTGLGDDFATVVYNNGTSDDPRLKFAQPSGLLTDALAVPEIYAQQVGSAPQGVQLEIHPSSISIYIKQAICIYMQRLGVG